MKRLIFTISFLAILSTSVYSQEENFSYPNGDSLIQHNWVYSGPILDVYHRIRITSPGLNFLDYAGSGIGRAAILDSTGIEILWKIFDIPGYTTGSAYVSMMINVKNAYPGGEYFAGISPVGSLETVCNVFIKDSSGRIAVGLSKGILAPVYTPAVYSINTTYLIVLKYTFVSGSSNDSVSLFIFDNLIPLTEPSPNLNLASNSSDLINAGSVTIFQKISSNSPRLVIDGIYFRHSWNQQILPVEIVSFNAIANNRNVTLNWATSSESNNSGFDIERSLFDNQLSMFNDQWDKVGFVTGNGTSLLPTYYEFTDRNLSSSKFRYRLKQIDHNGNFEYHNLQSAVVIGIPDEYYVSQNYPNPFNPTTRIDFDLPEEGLVNFKIYDINGREIKNILNEFRAGGYHKIELNLGEVSSGIYVYKIQAGSFSQVKMMALVK